MICETTEDVKLYQKLGVDKIQFAIGDAISNKKLETVKLSADMELYYRVVVGSYSDKRNLIKRKENLKQVGFESFLVSLLNSWLHYFQEY